MSRSRITALVTMCAVVLALTAFLGASSFPMLASAEAGGKPMKVGGEVTRPKPLSTPAPANQGRGHGVAVIECVIDEHGHVTEAKVVKSAGKEALDKAALDAVKVWTFLPATLKGKPVAVTYMVTVNFEVS